MSDISTTIYASVKPIFKIYFIIAAGFWLGRREILTPRTCKNISGVVVLILLPSLIFSEIVGNIGIEDIKQVGIIILCSVVLYSFGALMALIIYYATKVPSYWFGGCISCGIFPNVAELPIAYISSFSIFTDDETAKGLSYVVMFLATYCIVQFNFGAISLIEKDFEEKAESKKSILSFLSFFIINLKRPMSIAMIVSFICSLIPWIRALFVTTSQVTYPTAPDNQPPLSFVMDFCQYLSKACVPMGILVLGSTLSRLRLRGIPLKFWLTPLAITVVRVVILPIIGILFTDRLQKIGWFDQDRVLHFVCAISWGLPCATTLIYLTTACAEQDSPQLQYLACVYVTQYAVLGISLPILATWVVMRSMNSS